MGLFRPKATVTSPSGDCWELYVSKTALPAWKGADTDDIASGGLSTTDFVFIELPLALLASLWTQVVVPLFRAIALLPVAVVRGRRSHAVRIEAVTTFPQRQVLLWTTTDAHCDRVLEEIAAGLAAGRIVQPAGAVYSGAE